MITLAKGDDKRPERAVGLSRSEWDSEADALEAFEAAEKALDHAVTGATIDHVGTRTRWMALDGTVSWIDRKGPSIVMVIGCPAWAAEALAAEAWTASGIAKPAAKKPAKKPAKKS